MSDFILGALFAANCFGLFVLWLDAFRPVPKESAEDRRLALLSEGQWEAYKAKHCKQCSVCGMIGPFASEPYCMHCETNMRDLERLKAR